MSQHHIVINTLAKMVQYGSYYTAYCNGCGRGANLDMAVLIRRLGPDYPASGNNLGGRRRCGHRGAFIIVGSEVTRRVKGTYPAYSKPGLLQSRQEPR